VLRGLHFFGASFIVIAAAVHMLRVVALGSYKNPREVTWLTGVVLLLVILAFALTGYLLPWDEKAYWATTVTINIARSAPLGEYVAPLLMGGTTLGSLTLLRWYAVHVFVLPAALIGLVVAHLFLMRRHGISGMLRPASGEPKPFYPYHALKDTVVGAIVFAVLLTCAVLFPAPLDPVADPSDAAYVPRPEWYFLGLFQLLKYFPGRLEPLATLVIPALIVGLLLLLPFLDRGPDRHVLKRPLVTSGFAVIGLAIAVLTYLGYRDTPAQADPSMWGPLPLAGKAFVEDTRCTSCHRPGGAAGLLPETRIRRDPDWIVAHVRDPILIDPGSREPPKGGMSEGQARAVLSYMRKVRAGVSAPEVPPQLATVSLVIGRYCANCHAIDGDGASSAPDLTHVGATRDFEWLRQWLSNPEEVDSFATMPAFGTALTDEEMTALAAYLAQRR